MCDILFIRITIIIMNRFSYKYIVITSFNGFFRFRAEVCFRTIMKLPQKTSFVTTMCSFGSSVTLP